MIPPGGPKGLGRYLAANRSEAAVAALDEIVRDVAGREVSVLAEADGQLGRRPLVAVGCPWGRDRKGRPCAKVIGEVFATEWGGLVRARIRDITVWDLLAVPGDDRIPLTLHCRNSRHGPRQANRDELRAEYERARREGPQGRYFLRT